MPDESGFDPGDGAMDDDSGVTIRGDVTHAPDVPASDLDSMAGPSQTFRSRLSVPATMAVPPRPPAPAGPECM